MLVLHEAIVALPHVRQWVLGDPEGQILHVHSLLPHETGVVTIVSCTVGTATTGSVKNGS